MLKTINNRVEEVIKIYEEQANHIATRTRQMLEKYGNIEAISKLVTSPDLQLGFKTLRDKNMLDDTFEHIVLEYEDKFSKDVVEAAKWRLDNPYDLI
jgi:hypothetical protein